MAEPTLSLRQQQGVESRERILDAATTLVAERGYSGMTISALNKACGLLSASIYWHFGSKDGVLAAVVERGAKQFFDRLPPWPGFAGDDVDEEFRSYLVGIGEVIEAVPDFFRVLVSLAMERGDADVEELAPARRVRAGGLEFLKDPIAALAAVRGVEAFDVDSVARFCLTVLEGAAVARRLDPQPVSTRQTFDYLSTAAIALVDQAAGRTAQDSTNGSSRL